MQETDSYEAQTIKVEPLDRTCEDTPMKNMQPYDLSANPSNLTTCIEQFHNELSDCDQVKTRRSSIFSNFQPSLSHQGSTATSAFSNYRITLQSSTKKQEDFFLAQEDQCIENLLDEQPETPELPIQGSTQKIRLPLEIQVPDVAKHVRYTPSVKIDSLYKPILRRFRAYFRAKFDSHYNVKHFQHWTVSTYIQNVRTFMIKDLKVPETL